MKYYNCKTPAKGPKLKPVSLQVDADSREFMTGMCRVRAEGHQTSVKISTDLLVLFRFYQQVAKATAAESEKSTIEYGLPPPPSSEPQSGAGSLPILRLDVVTLA